MSALGLIRGYLEAIVAASAILTAIKSAWNGYVYDRVIRRILLAEKAHERTKEIDAKLDQITEQNERQTDAMVALAKAANNDDEEFDVNALLDDTDRENDRGYLSDD